VTALQSGIVRQAEAALKVAEAAYRFGERGFLEVLDAQRVFRAARAELITGRYELAAAWVEIERLRAIPEGK
jgi:cobalt-zinc-cadmium efflux system outer membrane protein